MAFSLPSRAAFPAYSQRRVGQMSRRRGPDVTQSYIRGFRSGGSRETCYNPAAMPTRATRPPSRNASCGGSPSRSPSSRPCWPWPPPSFSIPRPGSSSSPAGVFSALGFAWLKQSLTRFLSKGVQGARRSGDRPLRPPSRVDLRRLFPYNPRLSEEDLAFVAGFSTVVPVTLAEAVRGLLQLRKWKD